MCVCIHMFKLEMGWCLVCVFGRRRRRVEVVVGGGILKGSVCVCVCVWKKKEGGRKFICGRRTQKTNWGSVVLMCRGQQQTHTGFWLTATWVACPALPLSCSLSSAHPRSALKPWSHPATQHPPSNPPPPPQTMSSDSTPPLGASVYVHVSHICLHHPSQPICLGLKGRLFNISPPEGSAGAKVRHHVFTEDVSDTSACEGAQHVLALKVFFSSFVP